VSDPRVVLVTGGSRGLGAGLVQAFLDRGDHVATCSRSPTAETDRWAADPALADRFHFLPADLSQSGVGAVLVREVLSRFGALDVLINNAGVARDGVLGLFEDDDLDAVIDLNLKGTISVTKPAVRHMLRRRQGRIINISSVVGLSGYRGLAVYSATKAGLHGFTRALARELGSRGITVNAIAPGYLRTEMSHGLDEQELAQIVRRTPAGRLGEPGDIAAAAEFLASDAAAFITGQVLVVDGGLTA
jgi:3-oxoacyl-[acyl-carrier protein] reductase